MVKKKVMDFNLYESTLGTPSAQKILIILICWDRLPAKEIITRTKLSESQTYATIRNLETLHLIEQESRGIFRLAQNRFALALREAYNVFLIQLIGRKMYNLSKNYDNLTLEAYAEELITLGERWKPLIDKHFQSQYSALAGHLIDYKE